MRNERTLLKKRDLNLKLRAAKGGAVEDDRHDGAVDISEGNVENEDRPDFLTMPQSNNPISPRLIGTFLLTEHRGQLVASGGGHVITERAGIPRRLAGTSCCLSFIFGYVQMGPGDASRIFETRGANRAPDNGSGL